MNTIEDKILSLVKLANPDDPIEYVQSIVKSYAIEKINNNIKACNACSISDYGVKSIVYGNMNTSILMISDEISEEQYNTGETVTLPLMDTDGDTLSRALDVLGANKDAIYRMNSVNCYPAKVINNNITKRIPSVKERTACKTYIDKVISTLNPDIIITLGSIASNALSPEKIAILESRGNLFEYKGYTVMPTFHPGFFRQMQDKYDEELLNMYKENFLEDLYKAFTIALEKNPNCGIGNIKL